MSKIDIMIDGEKIGEITPAKLPKTNKIELPGTGRISLVIRDESGKIFLVAKGIIDRNP